MSKSRIIAATAVFVVCAGQAAYAQVFDTIPAEFPPASYTGNQYVDSTGCAFIRAGVSGNVTWVPRVDRSRQQLCGFQPSLAGTQAALPVIPDAPQVVAAPVAPPAAPARAVPVRAAPAADPGEPIVTVASVNTPPRLNRAPATPPVTPQVIAAPTQPVAPAPRQITRAEACAGRTGIQPGFISSATGNPIDCGSPAPVVMAAAPATAVLQAPMRERLTLAEACARIAGTNARLRNADTGAEVSCGMLAPAPLLVAAPAAPMVPMGGVVPGRAGAAAPLVTVMACQTAPMSGFDYLNAPPGTPIRCGPQTQSPSGITSAIVAQAAPSPARMPVPTRAMVAAAPVVVTPPPGYETVWDDGRLNPQRGLPPAAVQVAAVAAPAVSDRVSTRVAHQPVVQASVAPAATGHRYVQVGTFADPANAERTAARLQALGLPVGFANLTRNGTQMRVVAVGPFASEADLQAALRAARGAGFADAFTRS